MASKDIRRIGLLAVGLVASVAAVGYGQLRSIPAEVTPLLESDQVPQGSEVRAALTVRLPDGFHVQSDAPRDPSLIRTALTIQPPEGISVAEIVYPPSTDLKQLGVEELLAVFEQEFAIGVRLAVGRDVPEGPVDIPVRLRYQACNDTTCFAPVTVRSSFALRVVAPGTPVTVQHGDVLDKLAFGSGRAPTDLAEAPDPPVVASAEGDGGEEVARLDGFTLLGSTGGYLGSDAFLTFVHNAENGISEPGLFEGRGPLAILLIVFLGGLALNLTPCVLPMIPINLAIIGAGAQAGSRRRGLLLGSAYGAAMALVYGVLGLIVILTAGTFGTINASPWFNAAIAALFVVLGLAMFDVVTIDFSRFQPGTVGASGRGTFVLAFTMGGVAALLAGACVAPVVIQVVLFSSDLYASGLTGALALPFMLGLGMAIPWPFAGAGIAALPRPGPWMVRVKQAFGVIILATAAYYGYVAYGIIANRWVDPASVASSVEEKLKEGWYASLADGLAQANLERKPVLIDMWATWCKNCLTMDKTTLADPEVKAALEGYVKIKLQAEDPSVEPARSVMARLGAVGLPTYAILRPN